MNKCIRMITINITLYVVLQAIIPGAVPAEKLQVPVIERQFVMNVYDSIAEHWHHTRGKRKVHWHSVKAFLESLPNGTLLADVGCGDGKYFDVNPNVITIGCDMSLNLLQVSKTPTFDTFCSDAVKIPLRR